MGTVRQKSVKQSYPVREAFPKGRESSSSSAHECEREFCSRAPRVRESVFVQNRQVWGRSSWNLLTFSAE